MSELRDKLKSEVGRILAEPFPEPSGQIDAEFESSPSKPPEIETENIFDPDLERPDPNFLAEMESFLDDPMKPLIKLLGQYLESIKPPMAFTTPPKTEHKVRIFYLPTVAPLEHFDDIASKIEDLLNEGYRCHMPTVVNDYVIMDFSRRKESEENGE